MISVKTHPFSCSSCFTFSKSTIEALEKGSGVYSELTRKSSGRPK